MRQSQAVEEFLQKFEAMAPAADWRLSEHGFIQTDGWAEHPHFGDFYGNEEVCPLHFVAGLGFRDTTSARRVLGLDDRDCREVWLAADGERTASPSIRRRLLAAAGLVEQRA